MDYRRLYGLRAPRPVGDSTFMVPQMENYSLFASPFLDLNKKIGELIEKMQEDVKSNLKNVEKTTISKQDEQKKESKESEGKKLSSDASEVDVNFGIVLNVVTVKPKELLIKFGRGNEIEVTVEQRNVHLKDRINFSRNCCYKYELPDGIDKRSLVALRTSDDYLIILPRDLLREDLLIKSIQDAEELEELSDKEDVPLMEATGSTSQEGSDGKGGSKSKDSETKSARRTERNKVKSGTDTEFRDANFLIPVQIGRMLRPGMDIFMLRKYMADLESYVSTVRKFIENASFVSQNSKTAERCLRVIAKEKTDKYYEERNIEGQKPKNKFTKFPSSESGFEEEVAQLTETYDESTNSSGKS